ncbi:MULTISPECIES: hypothetical protein [Stenotrophomonas]|uniref:Lipoprotein n=1 Tax=Stenotrophomonas maltophilia TaxID=40324 RepID=A0A2J0UA77_STEMA|nr:MULTISPECIES: hypothetical protein [Stenotrophomonas]PJL26210.1 hypothetical protein B9Y64_16985 [Stenotrophomonas maltophilia]HDS1149139.1 hypothetical protein [Stenotrophomonas maltophilia]HDS1162326.1 hypothetical protein [Stenotrophomonas maltophilia]
MLKSLPPVAHVALIALITLAVAGCNKERSYPAYRENPAPKDALPIVIRVHDAPVDVPVPTITVLYEIDSLCLPPINNYEGVHYEPKWHSVQLQVERISPTEFTTTAFKDGMAVADYYGRGPCNWIPNTLEASFPLTIDGRSIHATVGASFQEIKEEGGSTTYIKKALKPLISGQIPEQAGTQSQTMFDKLPPADRPKYFRIEISSMD